MPNAGPHVIVLGGPNGSGKSTAAPRLLRGLYRPRAATWRLYDASPPRGPRLVAAGQGSTTNTIAEPEMWSRVTARRSEA